MSEGKAGGPKYGTYYVYELIDTRDGSVFYVGKGKGERVAAHERDAAAGRLGRKCDRIRAIWEAGFKVEHRIVDFFSEETKAYAFESAHIEKIGLANLTNMIPGGGGVRHPDEGQWTPALLKKAAPHLAKALLCLDKQAKFIVQGYDVSPALNAWVDHCIQKLGADTVAKAVLPYGVELVPA